MNTPDKDSFYAEVYEVVSVIPPGKVLTYGDIARLIGWPSYSRMVGRAMRDAPADRGIPCHRVVGAGGRLATGWPQQRELLEAEDIIWARGGNVCMSLCRWDIDHTESTESEWIF